MCQFLSDILFFSLLQHFGEKIITLKLPLLREIKQIICSHSVSDKAKTWTMVSVPKSSSPNYLTPMLVLKINQLSKFPVTISASTHLELRALGNGDYFDVRHGVRFGTLRRHKKHTGDN